LIEEIFMRRFIIAGLAALTIAATPVAAQIANVEAEHNALRQLKQDALDAANARDYAKAAQVLHPNFVATLVTQDTFTSIEALKKYFEGLYTRDTLRMKKVALGAEADALSDIYQGTFAITRGPTKEHYELADGRSFDLAGRWTAVSLKDKDGRWRIVAAHSGVNFIDNPVIAAIESSIMWIAAGAAAIGLLVGFAGGWFVRRSRA